MPGTGISEATSLYSKTAVVISTYIGGPVAAGVLFRRNFINLGKEDYGKNALLIGIAAAVVLIFGIFSVPEEVFDRIPDPVIPALYTGLAYLIIERMQGQALRDHSENNGRFYSIWRAVGIGVINMLVLLAVIVSLVFLTTEDFNYAKYDDGIAEFAENEGLALELFTLIETADDHQITDFISNTGIPAWQRNLQILDEMDQLEGIYEELRKQNEILREYCLLRIESYQLIGKAIAEDSLVYDQQIENIHKRIDDVLEKL